MGSVKSLEHSSGQYVVLGRKLIFSAKSKSEDHKFQRDPLPRGVPPPLGNEMLWSSYQIEVVHSVLLRLVG